MMGVTRATQETDMRKPNGIGKKAWCWNKHLKPYGKRLANKSARANAKRELRYG